MFKKTDQTQKIKTKKSTFKDLLKSFWIQKELWLICLVALVWVIIFCYIPMFGNWIAFFSYTPGKTLGNSEFVGLKYFARFFSLPDVKQIMRNTLAISTLNLTIGFAVPIVFSLLLNELRNGYFKKFIQTVSYMPHFVSWVVVASIMFTLLGADGILNDILLKLGLIKEAIPFLNRPDLFWGLITSANIWKGMGWSAIIYISAIAGVDGELYDAGSVDGLGRFGKAWHITLPGIANTIILLFILGIGNILSAGFEQQLLLGNTMTQETYEVIDTYVYRYGVQMGNYSFATAVGLMKSAFGFGLVLLANKLSKKFTDMQLF